MNSRIPALMFARLVVAGVLAAAPAYTYAHHSQAMFDEAKTIVLQGEVREFNWTNPHSSIKVDVDGVTWAIEMNSPGNLMREGWKRTSLKAGDKVAVMVHPLRDGKPGGIYLAVRLADGTTLAPGGSGREAELEELLKAAPAK
jgi:hypothetical protein